MRNLISLLCLGLVLSACSTNPSVVSEDGSLRPLISLPGFALNSKFEDGRGKVVVDLITSNSDLGYFVAEVDGAAPSRLSHPFITYAPIAVVEPGEHEIVLQRASWAESSIGPSRVSIFIKLDPDKSYRVNREGASVWISESGNRRALR